MVPVQDDIDIPIYEAFLTLKIYALSGHMQKTTYFVIPFIQNVQNW